MAEDRNFLSRWSERKLQRKREEEQAAEAEPRHAEELPAEEAPAGEVTEPPEGDSPPERHPAEDIDIESLTKESDFTIFMQAGVPKEVKRRALRKLWTSDPVLANLDGLNDYEDMTRVYGIGPIGKTAWKIGRGFLTDEEIGLNAREKDEAPEVAEQEETVQAVDEDGLDRHEVAAADSPAADVTEEQEETGEEPGDGSDEAGSGGRA
ncbi:DUF3306 domain-containing protein [Lutibaculum baratangense]|uniref:DUF3306 domain-containing protein n=1 Tax=Lutibaculum baratangense AMV1 TaxID=631454 RepID=V4RHZ9_9HYPH|nr:DUF3306 domain-containing protein [Lutibaculum baratangense]ESR22880.1 hypothetical protein N177_4017 [Lutibaculum baratangense AMV1]